MAATRLPASAAAKWQGIQLVQCDNKGRVYVLDGDTLDLFELGRLDGQLKPAGHLRASAGSQPRVVDGVMSPSGDSWLLRGTQQNEVHWLVRGDEVRVQPIAWGVSALAIAKDTPIVGVLPAQFGGSDAQDGQNDPGNHPPPLLLELDDHGNWTPLVMGEYLERAADDPPRINPFQLVFSRRNIRLAPARDGGVWMGYQNAYRVMEYSASGRIVRTLRVGDGNVKWVDRSEQDWADLEKSTPAGSKFQRSAFASQRQQPAIHAMTTIGSVLYLLTEHRAQLALDRYDPIEGTLSRVVIGGPAARLGRFSLANGADGLYIAGPEAADGIWRITSEQLEHAQWHAVPEATLDGQPLAGDQAPRASHANS